MQSENELEQEDSSLGRIFIKTDGVWRINYLTDILLALDGLITRIGVATRIASRCQEYNYVISNMNVLGLLKKDKLEEWDKAKEHYEVWARTDYVKFISLMRDAGVEVEQTNLGLKFSFQVDDIIDLAPKSSRPEIERIKMSSPGEIILLLTGLLSAKPAISLLERIFDTLFFYKPIKTKRQAEADESTARAKLMEAKVKEQNNISEIQYQKEQTKVILDYSNAIDSLISSLRNAGFDNKELKVILYEKIIGDIDVITRYKTIGLINNITITSISTNKAE